MFVCYYQLATDRTTASYSGRHRKVTKDCKQVISQEKARERLREDLNSLTSNMVDLERGC
jgi:hypothetical protein